MQTNFSLASQKKKAHTDSTLADSTSSSPADNISGPSTADPAAGLSPKESASLTIISSEDCLNEVVLDSQGKHNLHQQNCVECALSPTANQTTVIGCSVQVDNPWTYEDCVDEIVTDLDEHGNERFCPVCVV